MTGTITRPLFAGICLLVAGASSAEERILDYFSDIRVEPDGGMVVEETIRVRAEGERIKRGIYRDFPTDYEDHLGNDYRVGFELVEVARDGLPEPHHTERLGNGLRIYLGQEGVLLSPGEYTYRIRYRTHRQLGFFDTHDELYWNVTGNGWEFPIDRAGARVLLPNRIPMDRVTAGGYTGPEGAQGQAFDNSFNRNGEVVFGTTRSLAPAEGLTVVVTWPKGFVTEPDGRQRLAWFVDDNREALVGGAGLVLLLIYYTFSWLRAGRDPDFGVIVPLYEPPPGYSPASMRFVREMGYDKAAFAAAIVNMAVGGYLVIDEAPSGEFTLRKTGESPRLAPGESAIASALFGDGAREITLKQQNHRRIGKAITAHKRSLKRDYEKLYFNTNRGLLVPGILLSLVLLGGTLLSMRSSDEAAVAAFMTLWLTLWSIGVFRLLAGAFSQWRVAVKSGSGFGGAVFISLFAVPFVGGEFFGLGVLLSTSPSLAVILLAVVTVNLLFYEWMKAPTLKGRDLLRQVEGFRLYLSVAEQEELEFKHPPEKTPELFEAYLPYALALGVDQQWAERFSRILARAGTDGSAPPPRWYRGNSWHSGNIGGFASAMGSGMSSAVASSSTAPGSSSGSGGGGSSGGGGGGGGGGGW